MNNAVNPTFDAINNATGFANGDLFQNESEVREYFTPASQRVMFPDAITDEKTLNAWADRVISNGWHVETREEQPNERN